MPDGYLIGSDKLLARDQGLWARDKLKFLEEYEGPALGATTKKRGDTHYLDLFAGSGLNVSVVEGGVREFPGSPIQALRARFAGKQGERHFGGFHFGNVKPLDDWLLRRRVAAELERSGGAIPSTAVHFYCGDANQQLASMLRPIPSWAYLLVFADIEGPKDLRFETLRMLKAQHQSVDLYVLYPSHMAIDRLLAYDPRQRTRYRETLTAYFGTDEWLEIVRRRLTPAHYDDMYRDLRELYLSQLRGPWRHAEAVLTVTKARTGRLYEMIFAYDHDAAGKIAKAARGRSGQYDCFEGTRG